MAAPPTSDWHTAQRKRLNAFLNYLIGATILFCILEALAYVLFHDPAFGVASLTSASCFVAFLIAREQLRHGRLQLASIILFGAFLGTALIGSVAWPSVLPMLILLPLLGLVLVLPSITGRTLYMLIAIGWLVIVGIAILDEFLPSLSIAPPWLISIFRVSSLATAAALLLILMVQFSNRLIETLTSTEQANLTLRAAQAQLVAQQEDLRTTLLERDRSLALHRAIEERLSALSAATSTLLSLPRQRHVLPAILDLARQVITADAYALWRVHPTLPEWWIVDSVGLSESYRQRAARTLLGSRTVPEGVVATPDIAAIPDLMAHRRDEYFQEGIRALLVTPLQIQGELNGTLAFYYREPHPFSELEIRVATALSHLAAAALTTAELYDEQHRRRIEAEASQRDQTFLAEASRILGSSLDYRTTLAHIAELVIPQLADWCGIYLCDESGSIQEVALAHQDPAKEELARELSRQSPPASEHRQSLVHVMEKGEPIVVPNFEALIPTLTADPELLAMLQKLELTSYVLVPMRIGEQIIGVLGFGRADPQRRYDQEHLPLLQELAQRAASAVEHARLYRTAQDAIRLREQFLSVASHELKTPLTSVMGYTDLLQRRTQREGSLSARDQRVLVSIQQQTARLDQLIRTLFDISRIESGQLRLELALVDLGELARHVIEAIQPTLDQHQITFQGPDEPLLIDGDRLRLEQVLHNLIGNAVKYSPNGGTVSVVAAHRDTQATIAISDPGMGIPAAAIPRLFERFYRAPNVDAQYISGMGIGLYVVREIVALHGGLVEVVSQEGQGSTFTVVLPNGAGVV